MEKNCIKIRKKATLIVTIIVSILLIIAILPAQATYQKTTSKQPQQTTENKPWTVLYYLDCDYDSGNFDPLQENGEFKFTTNRKSVGMCMANPFPP